MDEIERRILALDFDEDDWYTHIPSVRSEVIRQLKYGTFESAGNYGKIITKRTDKMLDELDELRDFLAPHFVDGKKITQIGCMECNLMWFADLNELLIKNKITDFPNAFVEAVMDYTKYFDKFVNHIKYEVEHPKSAADDSDDEDDFDVDDDDVDDEDDDDDDDDDDDALEPQDVERFKDIEPRNIERFRENEPFGVERFSDNEPYDVERWDD